MKIKLLEAVTIDKPYSKGEIVEVSKGLMESFIQEGVKFEEVKMEVKAKRNESI